MLFEQYKIYVEWVDRQASRRLSTSSFFLAANSTLITALGLFGEETSQILPGMVAGIALCWVWYQMIVSNRGLAKGRFELIHRIEKELPLELFKDEWEILKRGKDKQVYKPFTRIEAKIPAIFGLLYAVAPVVSLIK